MAEEQKKPEFEMEYRMLGNTGLKVSTLAFGFWATYGVKEGVDRCVSVLRICRKAGINFFDNAEAYGKENGDAEKIMGQAIKKLQEEDPKAWRRSDIVISTKIFWGPGGGQNEKGLSRKHVIEGMNGCLERLQLDYVDVVFCHRPDPLTPTEEVVRAFTSLIRQGKAFYWGTSEWSAQQITEAYWIAKVEGLIAPVVEQPQYNMFTRDNLEKEFLRLFDAPYRLGTTIWSPLKSGILTGKYNKDVPDGSRMAQKGYEWLAKRWDAEKAEYIPKVEKLMELAKNKLDTTVACLAIAWCVKNKNVSCVLLGATKEQQIEENLKALAVAAKLTPDLMKEIEEIIASKPALPGNFGRSLDDKTNPL
mmetsp:Transcript_68104/g.108092  ORF Transcript_68104/g.108092 Transcript_68104/m.108092 type:complete len:362 (-) Transcript_68104:227-1312(-)|eukprot:CAMPEP_0197022152 /NCGR_PEP_ID=MMETSP1384-20130603/3051_1 /TAXON_ID=29189 /ORGANISM="Ammonia sp." /LENGTH=361 /DNA_ID=CAMNT_0042450127 /DNA_START=74 /DNA_END=1159 /DNA_ORIENTATION=+